MPTMYETIQELPLFKGTTPALISSFLEKTNVEFVKCPPGAILVEEDNDCTDLKFVISGHIRTYMSLAGGKASLSYVSGPGAVISPVYLFGMHTRYPTSVVSTEEVSYMQIRKGQYFELLKADDIYLLNILNYLSYNAQRAMSALRDLKELSVKGWIELIRMGLLERHTTQACIATTRANLSDMLNLSIETLTSELETLRESGEIEIQNDLSIILN